MGMIFHSYAGSNIISTSISRTKYGFLTEIWISGCLYITLFALVIVFFSIADRIQKWRGTNHDLKSWPCPSRGWLSITQHAKWHISWDRVFRMRSKWPIQIISTTGCARNSPSQSKILDASSILVVSTPSRELKDWSTQLRPLEVCSLTGASVLAPQSSTGVCSILE